MFAFVFEIRPILFPIHYYGETWIMHVTPNQYLLILPSSPVGKSSDLHAGVQQFESHSGHKFFFFYIHTIRRYSQPYFGQFFYLVCRYLVKKNCALNCCTPAWRPELLPTGLLGSVNWCWLGVASTPHTNVWGNKIEKSKILLYFF